ncbi:MAG: hypothetical protein H0T76_16070 [Nannocystis sp.]|nr:hypothetical protein [Nannocystis sp.]MBA3548000.1 hypothetical protein [Nannocystis sp.]
MTKPCKDRCDLLDVLEEAVVFKKSVKVELRDGQRFVDRVKNVVTTAGEDFAEFEEHARIPVTQIADCEPTSRAPPSYMRKLHEQPDRPDGSKGPDDSAEPDES